MKKALFAILCIELCSRSAFASCPNLAGHYDWHGEDGVVHFTIQQDKCSWIKIDNESKYLGIPNPPDIQIYHPDGKPRSDGAASRWVPNGFVILGGHDKGVIFYLDTAKKLHRGPSDDENKTFPECGDMHACEIVALPQKAYKTAAQRGSVSTLQPE